MSLTLLLLLFRRFFAGIRSAFRGEGLFLITSMCSILLTARFISLWLSKDASDDDLELRRERFFRRFRLLLCDFKLPFEDETDSRPVFSNVVANCWTPDCM